MSMSEWPLHDSGVTPGLSLSLLSRHSNNAGLHNSKLFFWTISLWEVSNFAVFTSLPLQGRIQNFGQGAWKLHDFEKQILGAVPGGPGSASALKEARSGDGADASSPTEIPPPELMCHPLLCHPLRDTEISGFSFQAMETDGLRFSWIYAVLKQPHSKYTGTAAVSFKRFFLSYGRRKISKFEYFVTVMLLNQSSNIKEEEFSHFCSQKMKPFRAA